jgi:glucose-6-phosphate 1-dehydrogenase
MTLPPVLEPGAKAGFVLFGATGDLARRMLWPSLFHLQQDGLLPAGLHYYGVASRDLTNEAFQNMVAESLLARAGGQAEAAVREFVGRIKYHAIDLSRGGFDVLHGQPGLTSDAAFQAYYLSTPPSLYGAACESLQCAHLVHENSRVVLEKPIGHDRASGAAICRSVAEVFEENQVFRVDHYLGKETVQNLLALRFGNALFEPLWNSGSIEHVQLTVAETVGVEGRWSYYDDAGALRDMVQNHMLQMLALLAMDPPSSLDAAAVRNEKIKVLRSLRPITAANAQANTVRGQYGAGIADGKAVPGYLDEEGARTESVTETFVALRADIDSWRWAGVPFYLRTGKRMAARRTEIVIQFKPVPHDLFASPGNGGAGLQANRLVIGMQPTEKITLEVMSKEPGLSGTRLRPVPLDLSLHEVFGVQRPRIAYERLLLDFLRGDPTLFVRVDEVDAAWQYIDGIHEGWRNTGLKPQKYLAGSWGPTSAIALAERHGHSWYE